jgi:hypothetical protein
MVKFRNDSGGDIKIPILAEGSQLVGAISGWKIIGPGKTFEVECLGDEPVNPALRVWANAETGGISRRDQPSKAGSATKKRRENKKK